MRNVASVLAVFALLALGPAVRGTAEAEYALAAETILCDCGCHPQSVHACACARAAEMRDELRGLVAQGLTGEQIIAKYVAEHGEKIRIAPTADGFNLVAWLGPFAALAAAAAGLVLALRRWRGTHPPVAPAGVGAAAPPPDAEYLARLARDLREIE